MNSYHTLPIETKRLLIEQTSLKYGLSKQIVEKDLWVSILLEVIFILPFANKLVFKGGTSLSKVWGLINRFSEDIDLAVDRSYFGLEGDLTVKQLKKLRKASSLFVSNEFYEELKKSIDNYGLSEYLDIEVEPNGEGDKTYPEPRKIYIKYKSLFSVELSYVKPQIVLEIGARSLFEPTKKSMVNSMISTAYQSIQTSVVQSEIITAVAAKTFLEKAYLLHELFTTSACSKAERKSRHLYDLEKMMDKNFAMNAIIDDNLWNTIHHHRDVFTHMHNVDYTPDIRDRITLVPPVEYYKVWEDDYLNMQASMIYEKSIKFKELIERMKILESRFRNR